MINNENVQQNRILNFTFTSSRVGWSLKEKENGVYMSTLSSYCKLGSWINQEQTNVKDKWQVKGLSTETYI